MDVRKNSHSALFKKLDMSQHWQWKSVKSLHIRSVPVPDPLKVPSESDGLSNIFVKLGKLGAVRTFLAFDRSMMVQSCLKHCVVVVCLIITDGPGGILRQNSPTSFMKA